MSTHVWLVRAPRNGTAPRLPAVAIARAVEPVDALSEPPLTIVHEAIVATIIHDRAHPASPRTPGAAVAPLLAFSDDAEGGFEGAALVPAALGTSGVAIRQTGPVLPDEPAPPSDLEPPSLPPLNAAVLSPNLGASITLATLQPMVAGTAPPAFARTELARTPAAGRRDDAADEQARQVEVVRQVVREYARAVERLDVQAAKALRPSLDDRALRKAFHKLDAQEFRMAPCGVSIRGQAAHARCLTDLTVRPKVGSRLHYAEREWTFDLSRNDSGWQIVDATIH